jgi:amidophosphoribosyltransferase
MCGFVGMVAGREVAAEIHLALQALQHRGQDSAGIATMSGDGTSFGIRRGLGTVVHALGPAELSGLVGPIGVGHVRYPTIGRGVIEDAQPFFYRVPGVLMVHNGNVTNYAELRDSLRERSIHLMSRCDVEPAICELADALMAERMSRHTLADALAAARRLYDRVRGAYSIVAALVLEGEPTLMVLRDPHGIRPAVIGHRDDGAWVVASESVAFDVLDVKRSFEPEPGEVVFLRHGREPERHRIASAGRSPCVFELIYFARPDAEMTGQSVYAVRLDLGRKLAARIRDKHIEADVVLPVPDTARPAATTLAETLGLPLREGFIKNRYSGRTFIMPDALTRNAALRLKLNTIPREISGRRVLLVDDSIVRGNTLRRVIHLVREAGAAEIHLAIHAPPVVHPCFYGIDMSTEEELFARRFDLDLPDLERAAAEALGADSLTYLSVELMDEAIGGPRCAACFDGCYPEAVSEADRAWFAQDRGVIERT